MLTTAKNQEIEKVQKLDVEGKEKYMRPSECRTHMRRTLAKEFQGIVDGFVEAAKKGSCSHVKLATELLKPVRRATSRKKGTATVYWEKLQREDQEKERLEKKILEASSQQQGLFSAK